MLMDAALLYETPTPAPTQRSKGRQPYPKVHLCGSSSLGWSSERPLAACGAAHDRDNQRHNNEKVCTIVCWWAHEKLLDPLQARMCFN